MFRIKRFSLINEGKSMDKVLDLYNKLKGEGRDPATHMSYAEWEYLTSGGESDDPYEEDWDDSFDSFVQQGNTQHLDPDEKSLMGVTSHIQKSKCGEVDLEKFEILANIIVNGFNKKDIEFTSTKDGMDIALKNAKKELFNYLIGEFPKFAEDGSIFLFGTDLIFSLSDKHWICLIYLINKIDPSWTFTFNDEEDDEEDEDDGTIELWDPGDFD
jgi:hypothetical protein